MDVDRDTNNYLVLTWTQGTVVYACFELVLPEKIFPVLRIDCDMRTWEFIVI